MRDEVGRSVVLSVACWELKRVATALFQCFHRHVATVVEQVLGWTDKSLVDWEEAAAWVPSFQPIIPSLPELNDELINDT